MKMPANAIPDSTVITFVYLKGGKEVEFTADKFPADFNGNDYKMVKRYDRVVRKGKNNEPPIKGFVLTGSTNVDSTAIVLSHEHTFLLFCEDFSKNVSKWKSDFERIYALARTRNIPVYIITAQPDDAKRIAAGSAFADIPIFKSDFKAILTAARTNPTLYHLQKGTVYDKWSYHRMSEAMDKLNKISYLIHP